jgi:hypothetical protein
MRDNSTLAKLLAEENISVVHKKVATAAFDVKRRELILPQWKEMPKTIQDLMTLHEVGHALWTSLEMLLEARERKIEHSFVNVIEDVRIESMIQKRYAGSRKIFRLGYAELIAKNFFETEGKDLQKLGLIDRINLHFKKTPDIYFSSEERDWVNRVASCKTEAEVLNTAEELYQWMQDNPEAQEQPQEDQQMMESSDESDEITEGMESSDEGESSDEETEVTEGAEDESEEGEETEASSDNSDEKDSEENETEESKAPTGGKGGSDDKKITATTDDAYNESSKDLLDEDAREINYYQIPKVNLDDIIVRYDEINTELEQFWTRIDSTVYDRMKKTFSDEVNKIRQDSKKTISYMVKEFEMKKAADLYARASTSKTGRLDLTKVHTYKYNDDLFAKVTTLPGATNHGMVIFLDWSASMYNNLNGTIKQLFNLLWFCQRVKIPFEVYAFSSAYYRDNTEPDRDFQQIPKINDLAIQHLHLLNFFSSNMSTNEFNEMLTKLYTLACTIERKYSYTREDGLTEPYRYALGGTPLDSAIIAAMDILPKFKSNTGVQKVNTIFLTDGESHPVENYVTLSEDGEKIFRSYIEHRNDAVITDPITGKKVKFDYKLYYSDGASAKKTALYLELLKYRVPNMNIVGFFIAGSGKNGNVSKNTIIDKFGTGKYRDPSNNDIIKKVRKELKKNNVAVCKSAGYDEYYVLPSMDIEFENTGIQVDIGASKSALKSAFKKNATNKTLNRPLLNKFIGMVA